MELSFVIAALRRRLWLVALLMLVGLAAGVALTSSKQPEYEAKAELLILPRTSAFGATSQSDPDRFIAGEVAVLKGSDFAQEIRAKVPGVTFVDLVANVRIEQKAKTDVVSIVVRNTDAARAQAIANAYATVYVDDAAKRDSDSYATELADIEAQLKDLSEKIASIEVERAKITPNSTNVADRTRDAQLFEQTSSYRAQYTSLLGTQNNLRYSSKLKSRSEVLQLAVLPMVAIAAPRSLFAIAGVFLGLVLGMVAAVAWANSSRRLLDVLQLEEIIGAKSVGTLPLAKELTVSPKAAFENLPGKTAAIIDQLCVRAEASAQGETDALTIAVVGSQRGAGVTTVALGLAGRFARNGARTVVIDGDLADPSISRAFGALDDAGIPGLLARLAAARKEPLPPGAPTPVPPESLPARVFTPTSLPDVRVLGVGAPTKARSLHRTNVDVVIEASSRGGVDVVVIDGGPLLDAASTVRLCQVVDVVVLVVPVSRQQIEPLGVINRLLGYRSGDLLPVATKLKPKPDARPKTAQANDAGDVDDIIEAATRWNGRRTDTDAGVPAAPITGGVITAPAAPTDRATPPPRPTTRPTPPQASRAAAPGANPGVMGLPAAPPIASPRLGAPPPRRTQLVPLDELDDAEWVAPRPTDGPEAEPR